MVATMGIIYYFCTVKTTERHEVAARMQRFLCLVISKNKRIECGSSNARKGSALLALTARNALSFMSN